MSISWLSTKWLHKIIIAVTLSKIGKEIVLNHLLIHWFCPIDLYLSLKNTNFHPKFQPHIIEKDQMLLSYRGRGSVLFEMKHIMYFKKSAGGLGQKKVNFRFLHYIYDSVAHKLFHNETILLLTLIVFEKIELNL